MPRKKRTKAVNKKLEELSKLLIDCSSWPEFNIKMVLNGYKLDNDAIIVIIHFAFIDMYSWNNWFYSSDKLTNLEKLRENCQDILVSACEDDEAKFTADMIDCIMKKTIFQRDSKYSFSTEKLKRILVSLAKKNPYAIKHAYEQYSTFAKYKV